MADVFKRQPESSQKIFVEDSYEYGYAVLGIEGEILRLRERSSEIVTDDFEVSSWRVLLQSYQLDPFPVGDLRPKFKRIRYHSRGSEFHRQCPVSLLYTMMDELKMPRVPSKTKLSAAGHIRHSVATEDCAHHVSLDCNMPRSMYCERDLEYVVDVGSLDRDKLDEFLGEQRKKMRHFTLDPTDIDVGELVLHGRADALLRAGPFLVVLDFKRGAYGFYEKRSNKLQFGAYALAVEQLLQEQFTGRILISVNRSRKSSPGAFKIPRPHLTMMYPGSQLERKIDFSIVENYLLRKQLLDDPDFFVWLRGKYMSETRKDGKSKCMSLIIGEPCFYIQTGLCDIVLDYVKEGGDMRKLLLNNVAI
jgi:hypothetical protein